MITESEASRCLFDCREIRCRLEWGTETRIKSTVFRVKKKMVIANFGQKSNTEGKGNSLREAEVLKPQAAARKVV